MPSLLRRALSSARRGGVRHAMRSAIPFIYGEFVRPLLPRSKLTADYNGIEVPVMVCPVDRYVPWYELPTASAEEDSPDYESEELAAMADFLDTGADVVIVGGGAGVTAVAAARRVGDSGSVTVFEAGEPTVDRVRQTVEHNDFTEQVTCRHAVVGRAVSTQGSVGDAETIPPEELPSSDYLELDCEGAEIDILRSMTVTPELISVETHAQFDAPSSAIRRVLESRGYEIVRERKVVEDITHIVARLE